MTNEEIKLLKNFIAWQSLPFVDNLFTHEDEIIKKFDEWLKLNIGSDDRMTNEEALRIAYSKRKDSAGEERDFLNTIIQALEQQPCEDCISREDVMKCFKKWQPYMATRLWDYEQELKELSSVIPKTDVLDKIRAEIIQIPTISSNANDIYKADVLAIIDKYKAESEE